MQNFLGTSEEKSADTIAEMLEADDSICQCHDDAAKVRFYCMLENGQDVFDIQYRVGDPGGWPL